VRRFVPQLFAQLFFISVLILLLTPNSKGQLPIKPSTSRQDIQNREWALGHMRPEARAQYDRIQQQAKLALKEDFRKLQLVNNDLMKRVFLGPKKNLPPPTPKEVRASLDEIKKVAQRLRTNLPIPHVESDKNAPYDVALSPGLLKLDGVVMSFVENPLFRQPRVYDDGLATKAGADLNEIVRLSDFLCKLSKHE